MIEINIIKNIVRFLPIEHLRKNIFYLKVFQVKQKEEEIQSIRHFLKISKKTILTK